MRQIFVWTLVGALAGAPAATRAQGSKTYRARLSPMPVPTFTPTVVGSGSVTATLNGPKLVIAGTFAGLNTAATEARVHKSPKPGLRGAPLFDLSVTGGTSGTIAGQMDLTAAQVQELAEGRFYVQLHSEKAAEGNLWGWLLAQDKP
ncbi:MAG: CHRD domain-containing protein [Luteitalea sp.]|nr:CHRD domain-containing protein [Luteitalea sp.]